MDMHSGITLSQTDSRPMYAQIVDGVKQRVAIGDWPPGHSLPSIRALATELRVSVITVKRAYLELEHEGVIVTRHGSGSTVAERPRLTDELQLEELDRQLDQAVRLALQLGLSEEEQAARLRVAVRRRLGTFDHKEKQS